MFLLFSCLFEALFFNFFFFLSFIFFIVLGGVLSFLERKYLSLVQRRVGPVFAGYKGRLQFLADALKVFLKEFIYINASSSSLYFFLPVFYFFLNLFFCTLFFYGNSHFYCSIADNYLIYVFVLSFYSTILIFFTGLFSRNKYSVLSSSRVVFFVFSVDFFFSIVIMLVFFFNSSFALCSYKSLSYLSIYTNTPISIFLYFIAFLVHINKAPFDLYEAESELVSGYFIEYSGFLFGLFVLVEYFHLFFFAFFFSFLLL